jgi:RNA polymerase sigma factor (sigma-70 family)
MTAGFPDDATIKDLQRKLTTFFKTRLPESTDPRDYVTDVLMTLPNFRGECSLLTYVWAVAHKRLAQGYRIRSRGSLEPLPPDDELAMSESGPSTELDRARAMARLRTEADAMGPPYGEVVRLRIEGLEPREIAKRTDIHYHTVRSRLSRGLEQLRAAVLGAGRVS